MHIPKKKKKKIALSFKFSKIVNDYADYPLGLKILQRNCSFRYKIDNFSELSIGKQGER